MYRTSLTALAIFAAISVAGPLHASLVLTLTDLGPAQAVNDAQGNTAAGQHLNQASTFSGGSSTQIVGAPSTANAINGDYVVGQKSGQAVRYNTNTMTEDNLLGAPIR